MMTANKDDRFSIQDFLFSRTDSRGVIQAGNPAFQSVSGYEWDQLMGAPQKIVRHPDTPSGVFFLLWDALKAGRPIGGYVLNRAKDGMDYWVYATMLPVTDGYISARIKPLSGTLEKMIPIYRDLRRLEKEEDLTPQASADLLVEKIKGMGFTDYNHFMSECLHQEVHARDHAMGRDADLVSERLSSMLEEITNMEATAQQVEVTFQNTHQIPYNMRLQAGRLEGSDGPISVISSNHRQMTQKLEENLARFNADSKVGTEAIHMAGFRSLVARLITDLSESFGQGDESLPFDHHHEVQMVQELALTYRTEAVDEVKTLTEKVRKFGRQCRDMRRLMSGLELTRIMCKIERSKFDQEHAGLDEIVNRLADAQVSLGNSFDQIQDVVTRILELSESVQRMADYGPERQVA